MDAAVGEAAEVEALDECRRRAWVETIPATSNTATASTVRRAEVWLKVKSCSASCRGLKGTGKGRDPLMRCVESDAGTATA